MSPIVVVSYLLAIGNNFLDGWHVGITDDSTTLTRRAIASQPVSPSFRYLSVECRRTIDWIDFCSISTPNQADILIAIHIVRSCRVDILKVSVYLRSSLQQRKSVLTNSH